MQVLKLPLPVDHNAWCVAAAAFERLHGAEGDGAYAEGVREYGLLMCGAYGVGGVDGVVAGAAGALGFSCQLE